MEGRTRAVVGALVEERELESIMGTDALNAPLTPWSVDKAGRAG